MQPLSCDRGSASGDGSSTLGAHLIAHSPYAWGGVGDMSFKPGGVLSTPWGEGRWVDASTEHFTSAVAAQFFNVVHMLVRKEGSGVYDSTRCSDGERLEVRVNSGLSGSSGG